MALPTYQEDLAVGAAAVPLTAAAYTCASEPSKSARWADVRIEVGDVRIKLNGADPTAATGQLWPQGSFYALNNRSEITNFRAICATGFAAAVLTVNYGPVYTE